MTAPLAQAEESQYGVLASIAMAVSADETGYGLNGFSQQYNDYFNITCGANGPGYTYSPRATGTVQNGSDCYLTYSSAQDSFLDFGYFLTHDPHYANLAQYLNNEADADSFISGMYSDGYANTSNISVVESIRDYNNLAQYDTTSSPTSTPTSLPTPNPGQSILQNGNFATNDETGWNQSAAAGTSVGWAVYPNSGAPALLGFGANGSYLEMNTTQAGNSVYQDVSGYSFTRGATYLAGMWVRNNSDGPLTLTLAVYEVNGTPSGQNFNVQYTVGDGAWHFIVVPFTLADADDTALRIHVYMNSIPGNYDFTDAFLMLQPATSQLYSAQYLGQSSPPANMLPGQQASASFTVRNTGQLPWYRSDTAPPGNNPLYLGTANPQNRSSAFYVPGQGWLSPGRIAMDQPMVPPGGTATFTYIVQAPTTLGSYTEGFDLVLNANNAALPSQWFGLNLSWTTGVYAPGCGDSRASQYADAYSRQGGLTELGAPTQCTSWLGNLVTSQNFNGALCCGAPIITQDEPDDNPTDSIPAFVGSGMLTLEGLAALGAPTSDVYGTSGQLAQNFAGGTIFWNNGTMSQQRWPTSFSGWKAEYWDRPATFDGQSPFVGPPTYVDDEPSIGYSWNGTPPGNGVWADHFSARWTRTISFAPGSYTFSMTVDDGGRLYVDGTAVIDQWRDQDATTYTWKGNLSGSHTVEMDYYQNAAGSAAQLSWAENAPPATSTATAIPTDTPTPTATWTNTPVPPTSTPPPSNTPTHTSTVATGAATATPIPPTGTPTTTGGLSTNAGATATALATPTSTAASHHKRAKAHPASLPLTVTLKSRSVRSGGLLVIGVRTVGRAQVSISLHVTATRMATTGKGKHRKHVRHTIVLYRAIAHGKADTHGRMNGLLGISYKPSKPVRALLTVSAQTRRGSASRALWLTIQPAHRHAGHKR